MRAFRDEVLRSMSPIDPPKARRCIQSRTVGIVLAVAGCGLVLLLLGSETLERATQTLDERVLRALRRSDDPARLVGPAWLKRVAFDLTALGSPAVIVLAVVLALGHLLLARRGVAATTICLSTAGAFALTASLKWFFDRARPSVVPPLAAASGGSFPSGHAALSAAVYLTMAALLAGEAPSPSARRFMLAAGVLVTFLVGATRVLMGVHYPSDVLAGWVLGSVWALLCSAVARRWRKSRTSAPGCGPRVDP